MLCEGSHVHAAATQMQQAGCSACSVELLSFPPASPPSDPRQILGLLVVLGVGMAASGLLMLWSCRSRRKR